MREAARNHRLIPFPDPLPPRCRHCPQTSVYLGSFDYFLGKHLRRQELGLCVACAFRFALCHGVALPSPAELERAA